MEISKELIKRKFNLFNNKCFHSQLPMPNSFSVKSYRQVAGQCIINTNGKKPRVSIIISRCFDFDEEALDETIIHEMIHYYLFLQGNKRWMKHGKAFKDECKRIKMLYGITIHRNAYHINLNEKYKPKMTVIDKLLSFMLKPFILLLNRL